MSYTLYITGSKADAIARVWAITRVCGLPHTRVEAPR